MAERDKKRTRIRAINPQALIIMDIVDSKVRDLGGPDSLSVILTEDITREEQIMALFEKYIKEGATPAAAERKAKIALALLDSL
jgi:hypothetical protein